MKEFKIKVSKLKEGIITCPRCEKTASEELHPCPYQCEINDDYSNYCVCCEDCTYQCHMDV
jgi:hypothetical protein